MPLVVRVCQAILGARVNRLIPPLLPEERAAFIAYARTFLTAGPDGGRVRFKHHGRNYRGVDCIGLCVASLAAVGREANDLRRYPRTPDGHTLRAALVEHLGAPVDTLQPGDIALMRWYESQGNRWDTHVGIITDYPVDPNSLAMIHAYQQADRADGGGEVIEHRLGAPWDRRIVEGFRP